MNWIEVSLSTDGEAAEALAELLQRYGHQGVVIEQDGIPPEVWDEGSLPPAQRLTIRAYLPADERFEAARMRLETALGHLRMLYPMPAALYRPLADEDWAEAWKAHYHPLRVGKRLLIRPAWVEIEAAPGDLVIALDPGMAFGTGTHPTTQLCLEALEDLVKPGAQVLDLGCGSGILSIAAAKLGAARILALDTDPIAAAAARENAARNHVAGKISAQEGSLASVLGSARRFDFVAVNILARIITQLCGEGLGQVVRPGGKAIFSGITVEQAAEVETALRGSGLIPTAQRRQGDWVLIEAWRPHD